MNYAVTLLEASKAPAAKVSTTKPDVFEVGREEYLANHLTRSDRGVLERFLEGIFMGIPYGVLAVGSSTFPGSYWQQRVEQRQKSGFSIWTVSYDDIDLRIVPVNEMPIDAIREDLTGRLKSAHYPLKAVSQIPRDRGHQGRFTQNPAKASYRSGDDALRTRLRNGRRLDLIVGDLPLDEHIALEQQENNSFSVLYRP